MVTSMVASPSALDNNKHNNKINNNKEIRLIKIRLIKIRLIKCIIFTYSSDPALVDMLDAVSLRFLHFNVC